MTQKQFTTFDITKILDLKIDRQKDWLTRGFIEPSIQKATGQGTKNLFSIEDVYLIALFQHLTNQGFARETAAERIKSIKFLQSIAAEADRIRKTKLNAAGLAKIRKQWSRIDDIDFIVLGWTPKTAQLKETELLKDLPPIQALRFADSELGDRIEITREVYAEAEDIILVNFKKIRSRVDVGLENG